MPDLCNQALSLEYCEWIITDLRLVGKAKAHFMIPLYMLYLGKWRVREELALYVTQRLYECIMRKEVVENKVHVLGYLLSIISLEFSPPPYLQYVPTCSFWKLCLSSETLPLKSFPSLVTADWDKERSVYSPGSKSWIIKSEAGSTCVFSSYWEAREETSKVITQSTPTDSKTLKKLCREIRDILKSSDIKAVPGSSNIPAQQALSEFSKEPHLCLLATKYQNNNKKQTLPFCFNGLSVAATNESRNWNN